MNRKKTKIYRAPNSVDESHFLIFAVLKPRVFAERNFDVVAHLGLKAFFSDTKSWLSKFSIFASSIQVKERFWENIILYHFPNEFTTLTSLEKIITCSFFKETQFFPKKPKHRLLLEILLFRCILRQICYKWVTKNSKSRNRTILVEH